MRKNNTVGIVEVFRSSINNPDISIGAFNKHIEEIKETYKDCEHSIHVTSYPDTSIAICVKIFRRETDEEYIKSILPYMETREDKMVLFNYLSKEFGYV